MVRAVERALAIFDAFDEQHSALTLQEIGERIGMAKATTHRLVNTLQASGFLVRLDTQQYCLSLKMLRLAGLVRSTLGVRELAHPTMAEVCKQVGEVVSLSMRTGFERVYVDVIATPSPLMFVVRQGEHVDLINGATGRMLLAHSPRSVVDQVLGSPAAAGIDRFELEADLQQIREAGYAFKSGMRIPGLSAIAVPIFDAQGEVHYTIALSGPSIRIDGKTEQFIPLLCEAGHTVSKMMGAPRSALHPT